MMEYDEIVVKESPGLCRCCLSEGCYKDLGSEYTWMNETEVYADMLLECFDISITQHNDGPNGANRLICEVCITRLRDACNFKKQVMDSENKFIDMIGRGDFRPKMLIYQTQQTQMKSEDAPMVEAAEDMVEYLDEEIDFLDDTNQTEESTATVSDVPVSALPPKGKRGRPKKNVVKTEKKGKIAKLDEKPKSSKAVPKGRKTRKQEDTYLERLSKIRRNVLLILRYGKVMPFNWHTGVGFKCFYCSKPMRDCEALKEHTTQHTVDLDMFIPKRIITKDVPIKCDVSKLGCHNCPDVQLNDLEELISHIAFVHNEDYDTDSGVCALPFVLSNTLMNCILCGKEYDNFTSMLSHMHKDHVSHSCVCQICGLSFMNEVRLKRHISNSHVGFRCSICRKIFNASHRLEKHKQQSHGQRKIHECNLCNAIFDNIYQLKVHFGKIHNVQKYKIQCEHCSKICFTKGAMMLHVQSQHSDMQYECDMCDYKAGIKRLITLHKKKHDGERDYSCSICDRQFRRASNLNTHMKVHSGVSGRVCRFCRKGFTDNETLKSHEAEMHYRD